MAKFKPLTKFATKGSNTLQVGVILPDTTSSTRYVNFDAPYLNAAFADAGYTQSQFRIDNAQGSDATELNLATADINLGARVLIMDPLDGPTGVAIAKLAAQHGVTLISYDRATFYGSKTYYVSFDNQLVGKKIGLGFEACIKSWKISKPQVYVLNGGEDTDPNAISFAMGYNQVVWGQAAKTVSAGATNRLSEKVEAYAAEVAALLKGTGFRASADLRNEKLGFKVREAELAKVPYMVVVGEREAAARAVSLRLLRGAKSQTMTLDGLVDLLKAEPLPS